MKKIVEFKNLNFEYSEDIFFENFNMSITEGDIVSLIGPGKSGKTTLLKMLCHKLPNDCCYYYGKSFKETGAEILRKKVIVVFDKKIYESDVKSALLSNLERLNIPQKEITEKYKTVISYFGLENLEEKLLADLDYRDLYLIKILKYLIIQPEFLAIDCIFSALTPSHKSKMIDFIKTYNITFLNIVNDLNDTLYGNKIYVLDDFELIMSGNTNSVLKADTLLKRLGFSLPLAVDLSLQLINYDVLKKVYMDTDKLVGALWK